jgi:hypothetical protein
LFVFAVARNESAGCCAASCLGARGKFEASPRTASAGLQREVWIEKRETLHYGAIASFLTYCERALSQEGFVDLVSNRTD